MKVRIIGFTGSRRGMTASQKKAVKSLLVSAQAPIPDSGFSDAPLIVALHGDCVGADEDFHNICKELEIDRQTRPCTLEKYRAHTDAVEIAEPAPPLDRNKLIVESSTIMIATPHSFQELKRSGTWSTIRYTKFVGKYLFIVYPDGTVEAT